ncbi:MAG: 50S ribosomal protein L35 [Deltaproteobacteria bacterium]|nr:50S ribosomal protein L35 [Deltaproteobacteria bacterium]
MPKKNKKKYKLKTHKGAAKRFDVTANGKVKRSKANKRHILESKSKKMKRQARKSTYVHDANMDAVKQMLPYG